MMTPSRIARPNRVTVTTGARVHFGLLTHRPKSGREFGGAGVMVSSPGWRITVSRSAVDRSEASEAAQLAHPGCVERARQILDRLRSAGTTSDPSVSIQIEAAIPAHQGLGSGSQLALALARGLDQLAGKESHITELARSTGRGGRSAIGTWGFECGGLLVDGGHRGHDCIAPLVTRVNVPRDWRFVLLLPRNSAGLSGTAESDAFQRLPGMSDAATNRLCRIIVMQMIPAFQESCFDEAAHALAEYGQLAGEYFAEIQGGLYSHPRMSVLASRMAAPFSVVQTSWGPGCVVLCRSSGMAEDVSDAMKKADNGWLETRIVSGLNQGAAVESS